MRKSEGFVFSYGPSNPVSKSVIAWHHHFQTKMTLLQNVHIVWCVALMLANRLSGIKVSEIRTG